MKLGHILRKWRLMSELSVREAAKDVGLDKATYCRLEQGQMPSAETLVKVIIYLIGEA